MRDSIAPTYDSRDTGPRYWVTTAVDGQTLHWRGPLNGPFVRHEVNIHGRMGLLRALLRGRINIEVTIGADPELMNDVLELDANQLVAGRTRRAEFRGEINQALKAFTGGDDAA